MGFPGGTWPSWAYMDMWAPELHFINGVFTLYFSARMKTTRKLALGVAVAKDLGDLFSGFKDLGYPLLQHHKGLIDPHFYRSDDSNFLLWKTDNNADGEESAIYIQELQEDGLAFQEDAEPKIILKADLPEERGVVEGPWILQWSKYFFLLYSTGGGFADTSYSIWAARASGVTGPYTKDTQPVVEVDRLRYDQGVNCTFEAPGHGSVVKDIAGTPWLLYHAWPYQRKEVFPPGRVLLLDRLVLEDGWPRAEGGHPSDRPRPVPHTAPVPH